MGFRFRLFYPDGTDAGAFVTAVPNWQPGDVFRTGDGRRLRIVRMVPVERLEEFVDEPVYAIWEVEPVAASVSV
jgi:hypothetical protein